MLNLQEMISQILKLQHKKKKEAALMRQPLFALRKTNRKKGKNLRLTSYFFHKNKKFFFMRTDFIGINNAALNTVSTSSQRHLK